jgi:hypothetical protein
MGVTVKDRTPSAESARLQRWSAGVAASPLGKMVAESPWDETIAGRDR